MNRLFYCKSKRLLEPNGIILFLHLGGIHLLGRISGHAGCEAKLSQINYLCC